MQWLHQRSRGIDAEINSVFSTIMTRLQRDMLLLLMAIGLPLAFFFGIQLYHNVWGARTMPPAMFTIHVARVLALIVLVTIFLKLERIRFAWISTLSLTLGTLLIQVWLLQDPSLLIFALFSLAGPAIVFPFTVNLLLIGGLTAALGVIVRFTFQRTTPEWVTVALFFATIMLGLAAMGYVVRRVIWQFAQATVQNKRSAIEQARLEQYAHDLQREAAQLASIEHDLRQPIRSVQGYLNLLAAITPDTERWITPALAAAGRSERLMNNLLDQARAHEQGQWIVRQPIDLAAFFADLQPIAHGLARYYTDPPIPVRFPLTSLPTIRADPEQLERALLNLLDNAFAYSSPHEVIDIRVTLAVDVVTIEIEDQGSGIPAVVVQALAAGTAYSQNGISRQGLGLRQVDRMARAHGGSLSFRPTERGTVAQIHLPVR